MKLKQGEYPEIDLEIPVRNLNKVTPNLLGIKVYKKMKIISIFSFQCSPALYTEQWLDAYFNRFSSFLVLPSTLFLDIYVSIFLAYIKYEPCYKVILKI